MKKTFNLKSLAALLLGGASLVAASAALVAVIVLGTMFGSF